MTTTDDRSSTNAGSTLEYRIGHRGRFSLSQLSGDIAIRGVEGDTVRVQSLDGRPVSDEFSIETGDGSLMIQQRESFGLGVFGRRESVDLSIDVPHGARVAVQAQSADIEAQDLSGEKSFRTASGEVRLLRLAGAIEVETVSGDIEIEGQAPIDLTGKSVSGDVQVRVPAIRRLGLSTTSGDIRLDAGLVGEGPFAVRSISGDVVVVGRGGLRVEAESITGDLSSDLPAKRESSAGRKIMVIGRPGPMLSFRSVSGDFHVAQPRDAAPEMDAIAASRAGGPEAPARPGVPAPPAPPAAPTAPTAPTPPTPPIAPIAPGAPAGSGADPEARRMAILRALERGDISVAEATDRLSQLDEVLR